MPLGILLEGLGSCSSARLPFRLKPSRGRSTGRRFLGPSAASSAGRSIRSVQRWAGCCRSPNPSSPSPPPWCHFFPGFSSPSVTVHRTRLSTYANFIKLEHTILSLPLIYVGAVVGAAGWPSILLAGLILLAAIGGRVMAMGLNRLIDAAIDARNPSTKGRELPSGTMRPLEAWGIVGLAGLLYAGSAAAVAPICLIWSPLPVALFVLYPYLKRFTALSHLGLGLAWSMAPLGGRLAGAASSTQAAVLSGVEWTASKSLTDVGEVGWLWFFSVLWVTGFDIIYATMDEAFDRKAGLHSLPAKLGKVKALQAGGGG